MSVVPTESPTLTLAMPLKLEHGVSWPSLESLPCRAVELHGDQARKNYRQKKRFQQEQFHIFIKLVSIFHFS